MKNNPKLLLYIAAAFIAFLLWQKWQIAHLPPAPPPASASVPAATDVPASSNNGADVPAASSSSGSDVPGDNPRAADNGAIIHVKTDVLELDIASKGGTIIRADLPAAPEATREDVSAQLGNLVFDGFISFTTDPWFTHLPRYLRAASMRLDAARADPGRDEGLLAGLDELAAEYDELCDAQPDGPLPGPVEDIGFLLEEYRVQLFAQRLGTSRTVSPKRIRQAIARAAGDR